MTAEGATPGPLERTVRHIAREGVRIAFAAQAGVTPLPQRVIDYLLAAGWQVNDDRWTRVLEGETVAGPCTMRDAWVSQTKRDTADMDRARS